MNEEIRISREDADMIAQVIRAYGQSIMTPETLLAYVEEIVETQESVGEINNE